MRGKIRREISYENCSKFFTEVSEKEINLAFIRVPLKNEDEFEKIQRAFICLTDEGLRNLYNQHSTQSSFEREVRDYVQKKSIELEENHIIEENSLEKFQPTKFSKSLTKFRHYSLLNVIEKNPKDDEVKKINPLYQYKKPAPNSIN